MKSLEQLISERQDELKAAGVTPEQIAEVVKDCKSLEQRLSVLKEYNPNPFVRANKIERKNGRGVVTESNSTQDVVATLVARGMSEKEACTLMGVEYVSEADRKDPVRADRMKTLRGLGFNESDAQIIIAKGYFFGE